MDIGIYARPDYYFQYDNPEFQSLMTELNGTTDPAKRSSMLKKAQRIISDDYVNGYLFELAFTTVANAKFKAFGRMRQRKLSNLQELVGQIKFGKALMNMGKVLPASYIINSDLF